MRKERRQVNIHPTSCFNSYKRPIMGVLRGNIRKHYANT